MTALLATAVAAAARATFQLGRVTDAAWTIVERAALHGLHEKELDVVAARVYDASPSYRTETIEPWEEAWWRARLPRRGRVLVGGCGAGREVLWLLAHGYEVEAFDPAPSLVALARERVRGRARVDVANYAAFVDGKLADGPFDAVVLGWGSFSHVLSAPSRTALLQACARVCPRGPILLSWMRAGDPPRGRASHIGDRLGRAVGALRGVPERDVSRDAIYLHLGPAHHLDDDEVAGLARAAGLSFCAEGGDFPDATVPHATYPHATLRADRNKRRREDAAVALVADVLARGKTVDVVARGGSMSGAIPHGSRVALEPPRGVVLGDVAAVRHHDLFLIHRIVGIDGQGRALLKGDACPSPDGWFAPSEILGRVAFIDDGRGRRTVPPATTPTPRWRRALGRFGRAAAALRQG